MAGTTKEVCVHRKGATWGGRAGCSWAGRGPWSGRSARPATERRLSRTAASKDVDVVVVDVIHRAGLSLKVARLTPLGVIKR